MTVNFSLLALDQIVNTAALYRHMSGGQFAVPLVIRMATGAGRQLAAQHSHSLEDWYAHIPGLGCWRRRRSKTRAACSWPALEDPDPVLIFEHAQLYNLEGELTAAVSAPTSSMPRVRRAGGDVTHHHLRRLPAQGARRRPQALAADGIEAEVIDLRVLRPLDDAAIVRFGAQDAPRAGRRRRLAQRQPRRPR